MDSVTAPTKTRGNAESEVDWRAAETLVQTFLLAGSALRNQSRATAVIAIGRLTRIFGSFHRENGWNTKCRSCKLKCETEQVMNV
jgi:hypothetical protein